MAPVDVEIVARWDQAQGLRHVPLLVLEPLEAFLDRHGIGSGALRVSRVGEGQSNVTFLVERDEVRLVLRRPPRPPLPPSAHDVLREARLKVALRARGVPVPEVIATCADPEVIGAPFYVMPFVDGAIVTTALPPAYATAEERRGLAFAVVDALVTVHRVDWEAAGLGGRAAPDTYLERQIKRFAGLWEVNANRDLPAVERLARRLEELRPSSGPSSVVHGDYRLGNLIVTPAPPAAVEAVLDWELSTVGDPLADLGYLLATWVEADTAETPLTVSEVTRLPGFPSRAELAAAYAEQTGSDVSGIAWYEALALWKAAVFCEAIYGRHVRGERGADDPFGASLERGVPALLEASEHAMLRLR